MSEARLLSCGRCQKQYRVSAEAREPKCPLCGEQLAADAIPVPSTPTPKQQAARSPAPPVRPTAPRPTQPRAASAARARSPARRSASPFWHALLGPLLGLIVFAVVSLILWKTGGAAPCPILQGPPPDYPPVKIESTLIEAAPDPIASARNGMP